MNAQKWFHAAVLFALLALSLVGAAGAQPSGAPAQAAWQVEVVYEYGGSYPSLALDSAGQPHIAFFGHDGSYHYALFMARYEGFEWQIEEIDDNGNGDSSLLIDAQDELHVSYHSSSGGQAALSYAHYYGGSWHVQTVDADIGGIGSGTALQLDAAGRPHILYRNQARDGIKYARRTEGGTWETETIVTMAGVGYSTDFDLALDAADRPHVSYYDYELQALRYGYKDAGGWHFETVDDQNYSTGEHNSLALDGQGRPHIGYRDRALKYARYDGGEWQISVVDNDLLAGTNTSLALDADDQAHIAYTDSDTPEHMLQYAYWDSPYWQIETVDLVSDGTRFEDPSLALDAAGRPHVAYEHLGGYALKYAAFREPCTPVSSAGISGPARLPLGRSGTYQAEYGPAGASTPVLYDWSNGAAAAETSFSWALSGTFSIQLTVTNACGQAQQSQEVEVFCQALEGVDVEGPPTLLVGQSGLYRAAVQPITASLPLTLSWSSGASGPSAGYSWPATGTYTVSVTATNPCGVVQRTHRQVEVLAEWPVRVLLPLAAKNAGE